MSPPLIVLFSIQAIVFMAFVVLAFRWLLAMRRDAVARSGSTLPGLGATLAAFRAGFSDPRHAGTRWGIAGTVLTLLMSSFFVPVLMRG